MDKFSFTRVDAVEGAGEVRVVHGYETVCLPES